MGKSSLQEITQLIDLETGVNSVLNEKSSSWNGQARIVLNETWNGHVNIDDGLVKGEVDLRFDNNSLSSYLELPVSGGGGKKMFGGEGKAGIQEENAGTEKPKKCCKKPPRPPRSSNSLPLDDTDQKLIKELSELAVLRQARIERMKKKLKNAKSTCSNNNWCALIVTILFCFIIIWQGFFPQGKSNINFHGSPESSVQTRGGLITIQFYGKTSRNGSYVSGSASTDNVEPISGIDNHKNSSGGAN